MYFKGTFAPEELGRMGYKPNMSGDSEHAVYNLFPGVELHQFMNAGGVPYVAIYEHYRGEMFEAASTEACNMDALIERAVFDNFVPYMSLMTRADLSGRIIDAKVNLERYLKDAEYERTNIIRNRMISAALCLLDIAFDEETDCVDALEQFANVAKSVVEVTCYNLYETKVGDTSKFCEEANDACAHKCIKYIKERKKHYDESNA